MTARKKWIAGSLEPKGTLTIDAGAVAALRRGKSLLPAGVIRVEGDFARGDAVVVRGPDGAEIGRGLVAYDAERRRQDQRPLVRATVAHPRHRRAAPRWCTATIWCSGTPETPMELCGLSGVYPAGGLLQQSRNASDHRPSAKAQFR